MNHSEWDTTSSISLVRETANADKRDQEIIGAFFPGVPPIVHFWISCPASRGDPVMEFYTAEGGGDVKLLSERVVVRLRRKTFW